MIVILKKISMCLLIFITFLGLLTMDAALENINVNSQIKDFMSNGVLVEDISYSGFYFYEVVIDEELSSPSVEFNTNNKPTSINYGDIYIERESFLNVIPFSAEFITFFIGGHAAMVYGNKLIETSGLDPSGNSVFIDNNRIFFETQKSSVVGLRVNAPDEDIEKAVEYAESVVDMPYNFSFVFNRKNSFYCTDLISRSYSKEAGLNYKLDKDGIAVSTNDLIISKDTYMIYYMHYDKDGMRHLYYAVNE